MNDPITDNPALSTADAPKIGIAWGDDISAERQRELDAILAAWDTETDHGGRKGPFDRDILNGADVYYLASKMAVCDPEWSHITDHSSLNLAGAYLDSAQLEDANLQRVNLEGAHLSGAQLTGTNLIRANLTDAELFDARLAGARLGGANLRGADLRLAKLDRATRLNRANLSGISVDQITLDNTNLAVASWDNVAPLGDEKRACALIDNFGDIKDYETRIGEFAAAIRANRLLATVLRAQGLTEDADVFTYHAQIMQRQLRFHRRQYGRWLVSLGLAALSGYGYRLWRIFVAYGLVLAVFAAIFWALGVHSYGAEPWYQALWDSFLVSLSAIHGRAVFEQLGAWTPAACVAAIESVVGIVIEGVFVAMLIQRLFR
jgi:hypothetical protein